MSNHISKLKIKGGKAVYGLVELTGDSVNSIALMVKTLMYSESSVIANVPRTNIVLEFIRVLETFGVHLEWISVDSIKLAFDKSIPSDITYLSEDRNQDFIKLLVPLVLKKRGECKVSNLNRSELAFYKKRGFEIKTNRSYSRIIYTKSLIDISTPIDFKNLTSPFEISAKFLILNLIGFDEDELKYIVNTKNISDNWYSNLLFDDAFDTTQMRARSSRTMLVFLTSISVLTKGEITISNFDLSEMLAYLLLIEKLGGRYIVSDNQLKIWYENILLEPYYDFTYLDNDYIEFALMIVVILSRQSDFVIQISVNKTDAIESLVRTLNILGFDLSTRESKEIFIIVVRPVRLPMKIKISLAEQHCIFQLLALSVAIDGIHVLTDVRDLFLSMPDIVEILEELGVNISYS